MVDICAIHLMVPLDSLEPDRVPGMTGAPQRAPARPGGGAQRGGRGAEDASTLRGGDASPGAPARPRGLAVAAVEPEREIGAEEQAHHDEPEKYP